MEKRCLGAGGPEVGAVGLGCMSFAGFYGATTMEVSHETLSSALDLGVTHLDTAELYGMGVSEEVIGAFLKKNPDAGFSIATKGGIVTKPHRHFNNSKAHLTASLDGSLKRLGVERIDLYYVHRREQERPIEDVAETLAGFVKAGKIGGFGFSEISPASLRRAAAVHPVRAVQSEYSLWTRQPELGLVAACAELGTAFVAFSPVARGMLSNEMPDPARFGDQDFRKANPRFLEPNFAFNRERVGAFNAYARDEGMSPATMANAWLLSRGDHVIPIPGTRSAGHLAENAAAASTRLTDDQLAEIDRLLPAGFAHGDRYSEQQSVGVERYC